MSNIITKAHEFRPLCAYSRKPVRAAVQMLSIYISHFLWVSGVKLDLSSGRCRMYPEFSVETENAYMKESFSSYPNISVDFGVSDICTMR